MLPLRAAIPLAVLALFSTSSFAQTTQVVVPANRGTIVQRIELYRDNQCQSLYFPKPRTRQAPRNGDINIVQGFWRIGGDGHCASVTAHGLTVIYKPRDGFRGEDFFSIDLPQAESRGNYPSDAPVTTYSYRILVR